MIPELDHAEALIAEGKRFRRGNAPKIALHKLRQSSILLYRAETDLQGLMLADLRRQAALPTMSGFSRELRDRVIALEAAAMTQGYLAGRGDNDRQKARRVRVERVRARLEATVRAELRGGRP